MLPTIAPHGQRQVVCRVCGTMGHGAKAGGHGVVTVGAVLRIYSHVAQWQSGVGNTVTAASYFCGTQWTPMACMSAGVVALTMSMQVSGLPVRGLRLMRDPSMWLITVTQSSS